MVRVRDCSGWLGNLNRSCRRAWSPVLDAETVTGGLLRAVRMLEYMGSRHTGADLMAFQLGLGLSLLHLQRPKFGRIMGVLTCSPKVTFARRSVTVRDRDNINQKNFIQTVKDNFMRGLA